MTNQFEKVERKIDTENLYKRYINNPEIEKRRPKMEEFKSDPDYKENLEKLRKSESKIEERVGEKAFELGGEKAEEVERLSKIFENFLILESKKIFGEDIETVPTSEFDDRFNNIDFILEKKTEDKSIRLGIDASISDNPEVISYKTNTINQKRIEENKTSVEATLLIKNHFINFIKPNLEDQFLYALFNNRREIKTFFKKKENEIKKVMFQIFGGDAKEKAALFEKTAASKIPHWNPKIFENL